MASWSWFQLLCVFLRWPNESTTEAGLIEAIAKQCIDTGVPGLMLCDVKLVANDAREIVLEDVKERVISNAGEIVEHGRA